MANRATPVPTQRLGPPPPWRRLAQRVLRRPRSFVTVKPARSARSAKWAGSLLLSCTLYSLLVGCASATSLTPRVTPHVTTPITTPATPTLPASGAVTTPQTGSPTPVTHPLAAPPTDCPLSAPPQEQSFADVGQLIGGGVFWVRAGYMPVLHLGPTDYTQWPQWKWVVEVGPNSTQPVTLTLRDQRTGALAWWSVDPPTPATQQLVLDPTLDTEDAGTVPWLAAVPHGESAPGWKEWGTFPVFAAAACYTLEAHWSGGSWSSSIAVGN
jgi:hypothetical protein